MRGPIGLQKHHMPQPGQLEGARDWAQEMRFRNILVVDGTKSTELASVRDS